MKAKVVRGVIVPSKDITALNGTSVEVSIDKLINEPRSINQNSYYFGIVVPAISAHIEETEGIIYTKDEIHAFNQIKIAGAKPTIISIGDQEVIHFKVKSTTVMTKKEFTTFVEIIRKYWAERGLDIPDPSIMNG